MSNLKKILFEQEDLPTPSKDIKEAFISDLDERDLPSNDSLWDKAKELAMVKFGGVPTSKGYKWAKKWYHFKGGKWNEMKPKVAEAALSEMNAISAGGAGLASTGLVAGSAASPVGSKAKNKGLWAEGDSMTASLFPDDEKKEKKAFVPEPLSYYIISNKQPDEMLITGAPKGTQVLNQFAIKKRMTNIKPGFFIYHLKDVQVFEKRGRAFTLESTSPENIFYFDFGDWTPITSLYP
jgi:hypothetical protein